MPGTSRRVLLALCAAMAAGERSLSAQSNTGGVYGTVGDEQGSAVPGGSATLAGPAAPLRAAVDAQGSFRFVHVPPGIYSLTVAVPGFAAWTREDVIVSAGRSTTLEIRLPLSRMEEEVTVRGETGLVDSRKVATGQNFSGAPLHEVPTSRDFWALAQQVPGVQLDTINVAGNASAIVGGPALTNRGSGNVVYAIDGAAITDNAYGFALQRQNGGTSTYFDFGTLQDVEVVTGGAALEQQTSGVTINVVTRRGTNSLRGSARFLYASANWQSDNTPESAIEEGLQTNRTRFIREYGAEAGGPIVEDRLWLWAAGARQDISLSPTASIGEIPAPQTATLVPWSGKLNAQVTGANAAAFLYQRSDREAFGTEAFSNRPPETRIDLLIPSDFYKLEDSNVFSADLFAAMFVSYLSPRYDATPAGGLDRDMQFYDGSYHDSYLYKVTKQPQKQANLRASKFFDAGAANHELKFSFNYRQQIADTASGLPGSQNSGSQYDGSSTAVLTRAGRQISRSEYWTGTLGDTLAAGNLTVSAGIRFDLQRGRTLPSSSPANAMFSQPGPEGFPGLPELRYHGAGDWQFEFTNWQPRISATYALGSARSTLIRASYARYVDQLGWLASFVSGIPTINGYHYGWNDLNHDHDVQPNEIDWSDPRGYAFGVDPTVLPEPANEIAPDFRMPPTDEVTVGFDQQLGEDLAASVTFSYRHTTDLQFLVPVGSTSSTWAFGGRARGTATDASGFTIRFDEPYYDLILPGPPPGGLVTNRTGASQRYLGLDVSLVKRLSRNWMVRANFGWNDFRQYVASEAVLNPNNLWNWGGQNDDGGLATGVSPRDNVWLNAGWQFNLSGLYRGPWGLTLGANVYGRQGYPRPYRVVVHTDDVAFSTWSLLIDEVGAYRYPDVYELDLRLERPFQIGPITVTPAVELFNAANGNALLNSDPTAGDYFADRGAFEENPFFNETIEIQSPRIVRLGIQVSF